MDSNELDAFRARVLASPGAWTLLERDAYLPFDEDAHGAGQARLSRAWDSVDDLSHALRGEKISEAEAEEVARMDRARWDELLEENERREAETRKASDDYKEAA